MSDRGERDREASEQPFHGGTAGASARREHERRKAKREQGTRAKHPRLGGLLIALQNEPREERVWATGASGEERIAERLAELLAPGIMLLHDRRVPSSRANIDHIAVAPSGVWVIDTKRYQGKVEIRKPLFQAARLTIAGRDKSKLVEGLARQVDLVRASLGDEAAIVPVQGALCFVDAELPAFGTLTFKGFPLLYVKALAKRINKHGAVSLDQIGRIAGELARRLPPA